MNDSPIMTVKDLATYLKIHETTVYRLLKRGELPSFRVGSDHRFHRDTIDKWRLGRDAEPRPLAVAPASKKVTRATSDFAPAC